MARHTASLLLLGACNFTSPPPANITPDVPPNGNEAGAEMQPPEGEAHLLITEVLANGDAEFIEVHNATGTAIDLAPYHLTDVADYWRLSAAIKDPISEPLVFGVTDFLVRFPDGATIDDGETIVVAIHGPAFEGEFGVPPTFTVVVPTTGAAAMVEVIAPTAQDVTPRITDSGEPVVLFLWDGMSDLVTDVDLVVHGMPTSNDNRLSAKAAVDGPDADAVASAYPLEPSRMSGMTARAENAMRSYKRIMFEGVNEADNGSGVAGHDETSEVLSATWNTGSEPRTPGMVELP